MDNKELNMKYIDIKDIKKGTANTVLGLNDADEAVLSEINIDLSEYVTEDELALKGYVNTEDLDRALTEKQDRLVSGENIATINGNSLLDGGDLIIQGGSGAANIVSLTQAEYDELVSSGAVDMETLYLITDATVDANFKTINGSYVLGDGNIDTNQIITLTQAEYDALGVYEDDIFYVITDPVLPEYVAPDDMYEYVDSVLGNINNELETIIG